MDKDTKLEEFKETIQKNAECFAKIFSTPEGVEVLKILKKELNPIDVIGDDVHTTYFNLGKRDAFKYIELYIKHGE